MNQFTKPYFRRIQTLLAMDASTNTGQAGIPDLYTLTLVDGLKAQVGANEVRYRVARLRETTVNDERAATRLSERVVYVAGQPQLLSSPAEFRLALTMKHIERLEADGTQALEGPMLDLDLFGRLSPHDVGLIEERVFLITLASQVRYGLISQADFDKVLAGKAGPATEAPSAPQPLGQAAAAGAAAAAAESGPALLADFAGRRAGDAAAGDGR